MNGLRILGTAESREWNSVLARTVQHDFHHLPEYHRVAEECGEGAAHLFAWCEAEHVIALPLLLRPIDGAEPAGLLDATSVYGYGGPVASSTCMPESVIRNFQSALHQALVERQVVAAFSRLHPLIAQEQLLAGFGECRLLGETISIDLTLPLEEQWSGYRKSCRYSINKLRRDGFVAVHDREKRYLPEFVSVYQETMRRTGAQTSYFWQTPYFELLARELGEALQLFVVLRGEQVAAATLATICTGIVQDHLGGTRDKFLQFSPDRLVVDTERLWAISAGARALHLGGGVGSQQDCVFQYKSGFSKRRHGFSTWCYVVDRSAYDQICRNKGLPDSATDYFPAYRCPVAGKLEIFETHQPKEWTAAVERAYRHDVYHLPGYHALAAAQGEGKGYLFHYTEGEFAISLPLLLRGVREADSLCDATSVYGYAGPLASHPELPPATVQRFQTALRQALNERRVVTLFTRLHPLLDQAPLVTGLGECRSGGQTISIDLKLPADRQQEQLRKSYKRDIDRLRRLQMICADDTEWREVEAFVEIYRENMQRVAAQPYYFFDRRYFESLRRELDGRVHLFIARLEGRVAAGAIVIECDGTAQYHLGATQSEFRALSPMKFVFDSVCVWGRERGLNVLHLGGGVGSQEDSLFHFKAGFSDQRHRFATWRWTLMPEVEAALAEEKSRDNQRLGLRPVSDDWFPSYRCPTEPEIVEGCDVPR